MQFRTDRQRATGLGAAKEGVSHWWNQRVSAVALAVLVLLFIWPLGAALGESHEEVLETYRNPFNAIVAILMFGTAFFHLKLGLQVVIEDYVHGKAMRTALLLANTLLCAFFGIAGIFAVVKIALGA
ncbi:succinate dehydrogenase, hydrophobic membrane anchor protein [Paroceanicella profunda]|uniref:Succinate dehydrogenase hydrophobic membrane anchor subunit n=1 Tax=Paroceanicella profunda TaxID=2579971 RepID=A0A5B8FUN5_9RHOB|nr:succinate dehydrogenase, hydrophobic membrane anchor protein [Paroceanicella profunda]QDL90964.1 succinate dehydrogenase, hydrophobic membrane anchor protein [Paroceanicella profunda]